MNSIILILPLLTLSCQAIPVWKPTIGDMSSVIQGGQVLSDILMVSSADKVAPAAEAFIRAVEGAVTEAKLYLSWISQMIQSLDSSPYFAIVADMMQKKLLATESAINDVENTARLSGDLLNVTLECVAPMREKTKKIKDDTLRNLLEVVGVLRGDIMDLAAAGYSIEEQMSHLFALEKKVANSISADNVGQTAEVPLDNRIEAEKEVRMINRAFKSVADDIIAESLKAFKQLEDIFQRVQVDGTKILMNIELCVKQKFEEKAQEIIEA